jgi:hypothetical protein
MGCAQMLSRGQNQCSNSSPKPPGFTAPQTTKPPSPGGRAMQAGHHCPLQHWELKGARVSMVTTQNPDGQMTHHTTKRAVEDAIIDANKFKYSQSTATPRMQPSCIADFGYTGNTPVAEAVLNGTYIAPPDCDPVLQDFLVHCKRPPGIPVDTCPRHITTSEHCNGWKKAKEHTQAGRSKITFAMFKANTLNPDLAAVDASFRNIGYATGFAFDRWKTGINCMLLKKRNIYLVNKLRTILLLEADSGMN